MLEYARTLGGSSLLSTLEMDLRKGLRARSADSDDARYLAPRCEAETNRTHKITKAVISHLLMTVTPY